MSVKVINFRVKNRTVNEETIRDFVSRLTEEQVALLAEKCIEVKTRPNSEPAGPGILE